MLKDEPKTFDQIRSALSGAGFNVAIANAKKNGWIKIEKNNSESLVSIKEKPIETPEEKLLSFIGENTISQEQVSNPMGPMRFELMAFRLSVERSSQAELRALENFRGFGHLSLLFFPLD